MTQSGAHPDAFEKAEQAAAFVAQRTALRPSLALVLGSGFGSFADQLLGADRIPYADIPHLARPTVEGHRGELAVGTLGSVPVAVLSGRIHLYEGYSPEQATFPTRMLRRFGISMLVLTNAAGGIRTDLQPGQLVLISDHINFTGKNPLAGPNEPRFGGRFPEMSEVYSGRLRALAEQAAGQLGMRLPQGVYLGIKGPSYETPAEIRAFRAWGADLVGMSTVHEAIVARHMGMEVLGLSCVTNLAAGLGGSVLQHADVVNVGERAAEQFARFMLELVPLLTLPPTVKSTSVGEMLRPR